MFFKALDISDLEAVIPKPMQNALAFHCYSNKLLQTQELKTIKMYRTILEVSQCYFHQTKVKMMVGLILSGVSECRIHFLTLFSFQGHLYSLVVTPNSSSKVITPFTPSTVTKAAGVNRAMYERGQDLGFWGERWGRRQTWKYTVLRSIHYLRSSIKSQGQTKVR